MGNNSPKKNSPLAIKMFAFWTQRNVWDPTVYRFTVSSCIHSLALHCVPLSARPAIPNDCRI